MIAITRQLPAPASAPRRAEAVPQPRKPRVPDAINRATLAAEHSVQVMLSTEERQALAMLARRAWKAASKTGQTGGLTQEAWRHAQAVAACGRRISEAVVDDYCAIESRLADIAKRYGQAFDAALRGGVAQERIARAKLEEECRKAGLELSYPAKIARSQFKRALDDLSAKQIWCLVFTVRNRTQSAGSPQHRQLRSKGRDYVLKPAVQPAQSEADPF